MVRIVRIALCAPMIALGPGGAATAAAPAPMSKQLGGYRAVSVDDAGAQAAAQFAAGRTGQDGASLAEVTKAERQTVAGTNWRLEFRMDNGSQWQAVVFQALDGSYTLTSIEEFGE